MAAVPKSCASNYDDTRGNFQSDDDVWSLGKLGQGNKESANVKPKAVLAYCREKGIKAVDIRFPDSLGRWRHFTIPASGLTEAAFEFGLGQESCLPGLAKMRNFHGFCCRFQKLGTSIPLSLSRLWFWWRPYKTHGRVKRPGSMPGRLHFVRSKHFAV